MSSSHKHLQRVPIVHVLAFAQLADIRVEGHERVSGTQVERVIDTPIHFPHLARRMEETLQDVAQQHPRTQRHAHRFDGVHDRADDMRGGLEAVRPDEVHQVHHRILAAEPGDTEREMLDVSRCPLSMNKIPIRQRVFEHSDDGVCVVCGLGPNILEDERERLQTTRPDVELGRTVLVQDGGKTCESCQ